MSGLPQSLIFFRPGSSGPWPHSYGVMTFICRCVLKHKIIPRVIKTCRPTCYNNAYKINKTLPAGPNMVKGGIKSKFGKGW
jgi:hypothetical protein